MTAGHRGLEQSVMSRLGARARELGVDPNVLLARFVVERFLYRLSRSPYASRFVVKGATLMPVWLGDTARPTRDADLAGFGDLSDDVLRSIFHEICAVEVEADGVSFDATTVRVAPIRENDVYGGSRVTILGRIGRSRVRAQIDVGIGDAISPAPVAIALPGVLDFPRARMRAYRPETSIAEKFQAIVTKGTANSRMKDFYDIDRLAAALKFDATTLRKAIEQTFSRRGTDLPSAVPEGLSDDFAQMVQKQTQWRAFARRVGRGGTPAFEAVVQRVRGFLMPLIEGATGSWPPGGPWQVVDKSNPDQRVVRRRSPRKTRRRPAG